MTTARRGRISLLATLAPWILLATAFAGGPLTLGGPSNGTPGQALGWNPAAMPIQYRIDVGPMSTTFGGQIAVTNAIGLQRVQAMFGNSSTIAATPMRWLKYATPALFRT